MKDNLRQIFIDVIVQLIADLIAWLVQCTAGLPECSGLCCSLGFLT
ncbi:hypothetical protein [Phytopseudomonas flavescens]|nr:hypothetical protein [Pseudomonas flavescens]